MAPEQFLGKTQRASDQYALGIVIYEWLCGDRPFHGSFSEMASQHLLAPPPPLRQKVPAIPPAVEEVVLTMLAKEPANRFASMLAFTNAWEQACSSPAASAVPVMPIGPTPPRLDTADEPRRPGISAPSQVVPPARDQAVPSSPQSSPGATAEAQNQTMRAGQAARTQQTLPGLPAGEHTSHILEKREAKGLSRRALVLGLVGTAVVVAAGGTFAWLTHSQGQPTTPGGKGHHSTASSTGAMFGFDPQHTHFNPQEHVLMPMNVSHLALAWKATTDDIIASSPAASNGILYVSSKDHKLYAFNATTGQTIWVASAADKLDSSPAAAGGIVYVGSYDHKLYAFDAVSSRQLWAASTNDSIYSSSPVVADGIVYIGSRDHALYAFDSASGNLIWKFVAGDVITSSPAAAGGLVYIGSYDYTLYALDAQTGTLRWKATTGSDISSSPAIAYGNVYIGSEDNDLYAYNASTGALLWSSPTGGSIISAPAVANNVVYVGSYDHSLYAFDANTGTQRWKVPTGDRIASSPMAANGVIYIGSNDRNIYAFNAVDGAPLWKFATGGAVYSSPTVTNGMLYVGSEDGVLYAFHLPAL
jgi:eukaryotic-like serine/threonine-protein kinase